MAYVKRTNISGYNTTQPRPEGHEAIVAYVSKHRVFVTRRGHWSAEYGLVAARRAGIVGEVTVEHVTHDTNGKGYGGIDGRWIVTETDVRQIEVSPEEQDTFATVDMETVWDAEAEYREGRS